MRDVQRRKLLLFSSTELMNIVRKMYAQEYATMSSFTCWILQPSLQHESPGLLGLTHALSSSRPPKYSLEKTVLAIVLHTYTRNPSFSVRWGHLSWVCKVVSMLPVTLMKKQTKWSTVQNSRTFSASWAIAFPKQGLRKLGVLKFSDNKYRNM